MEAKVKAQQISIHALREEGDAAVNDLLQRHNISIHALREEGDQRCPQAAAPPSNFYPRPPRGGRHARNPEYPQDEEFLSTPSARRATYRGGYSPCLRKYFYPRPPRGGRRLSCLRRQAGPAISIHALREEGDWRGSFWGGVGNEFLSTPSARRATVVKVDASTGALISIHALREEGDTPKNIGSGKPSDFYPRPPRGGRLQPGQGPANPRLFLSTPSARRATGASSICTTSIPYFYPRPPRGGRPAMNASIKAIELFLSTPSARRATARPGYFRGRYFISIHALREEGDEPLGGLRVGGKQFLSTPSARRATAPRSPPPRLGGYFYPRPPRGGRPPFALLSFFTCVNFYPRPPRGGRPSR